MSHRAERGDFVALGGEELGWQHESPQDESIERSQGLRSLREFVRMAVWLEQFLRLPARGQIR